MLLPLGLPTLSSALSLCPHPNQSCPDHLDISSLFTIQLESEFLLSSFLLSFPPAPVQPHGQESDPDNQLPGDKVEHSEEVRGGGGHQGAKEDHMEGSRS